MKQNLDILLFSFESNVFIKCKIEIFWSFERIGGIVEEMLES